MDQQKENEIKKQLGNWLKDEHTKIFYYFLDKKEATVHQLLDKDVFKLKNNGRRPQFKQWAKKYFENIELHLREPSVQENILEKIKAQLDALEINTQARKQAQLVAIQQALHSFKMQMVKSSQSTRQYQMQKQENLIQIFKSFFNQLFNLVLNQEPQTALIEGIIKYGTFQAVKYNRTLRDLDTNQLFEKMLQASKSYNSLKKYGGKDLQLLRHSIFSGLKEQLTKMKTSAELICSFLQQLVSKPTSNCVAICPYLGPQVKRDYYLSQFYKSGKLNQYAQLAIYPQSLHSIATNEASSIIKFISETTMITQDIVGKIFNFDLIGLLKIPNITPIKKDIFNFVKNKCPNYYKLSTLVRYQEKSLSNHENNRQVSLRFALRQKFLEVGLRFQDWQTVEEQIMSRKQSTIHRLKLTLEEKQILRRFYWQNIQTYFHSQEKQLKYSQQLDYHLLELIMNSSIQSEKNMVFIQKMVKQIVQTQSMAGPVVQEQLTTGCKKELFKILKDSQLYQQYVKNRGVDLREKEYLDTLQLKKEIYEKNFQNQVQQSYHAIQQKVNQRYRQKIQTLVQTKPLINPNPEVQSSMILLRVQSIKSEFQNPFKQPKILITEQNKLKRRDQLVLKLKIILQNSCAPQSRIISLKNSKFIGKQLEFYERLIIANPFMNSKIQHSDIKADTVAAKKITEQCQKLAKNNKELCQLVSQYQLLDEEIQSQDQDNSSQRFKIKQKKESESPEKLKQQLLQKFYVHVKKNTQSSLMKAINNERCQGEFEKFLSKVLQTNLLVNVNEVDENQIKREFNVTKVQVVKIRKQLQVLRQGFEKDFVRQYQNIKKLGK